MDAVTRWKTIATIAVAFSAGNLFATACQDAGGGKANAEDDTTGAGDGTSPPPEVSAAELAELETALAATEAEVAALKCFVGHMLDDEYWEYDQWKPVANGYPWNQGPNSDASKAYEDCF